MLKSHIIYFLGIDRDKTPYSPTRRFSIAAYNRVIGRIMDHGPDNMTIDDVKKLQLTEYMKQKICGYFGKKIPKKANREILRSSVANITGIGYKKADELIKAGLSEVDQLTSEKYYSMLNTDSQIAVKHKPLKKIPYKMIKEIVHILTKFKDTILVGGHRRKKTFSKDIDVMLVSKNSDALDKYTEYLTSKFKVIVYLKGPDKVSMLIKHKSYLKLDVFKTTPSSRHSMLLYATGSKNFNIKMRAIAKKQGYLLNQNGLFKDGKKIDIRSEKGFFKKLKMSYVEPENR